MRVRNLRAVLLAILVCLSASPAIACITDLGPHKDDYGFAVFRFFRSPTANGAITIPIAGAKAARFRAPLNEFDRCINLYAI